MPLIAMFLALLAVHALADYPLQGPYLSAAKRRLSPEGAGGVWCWALVSHAAIHGLGIWLVTRSLGLALAEVVAHALIDFAKCERKINVHADQIAHVLCKLLWVLLIAVGVR